MAPFRKILHEIHRRSLWQVAGVYLAGSWGALQAIDILVDSLGLARWLPALAILLILVGLPLVLATAFFQEGVPLRTLLGEIHRRFLWQTVGVYLAGSWVALELVDILVGSLEWPSWLPALAILIILMGLPVVVSTRAFRAREEGGRGLPPSPIPRVAPPAPEADESVPVAPDAPVGRRLFNWRNVWNGGVLAFALWGVVATGWLLLARQGSAARAESDAPVDANLVAVLPFRVVGPEGLTFLGEGMVDLLAAKLTGEGGFRAADPRSVMSAWHRQASHEDGEINQDAAASLGRSLGAGRVLLGGIVGTPSRLVLNASVVDALGGGLQAQASVEGPPDSLTALVDRLTVQLLALESGEEEQRLAELTSQSLPALRAYLAGHVAYRRGRYSEADARFEEALEMDSTFALAALGWVASAWWQPGFEQFDRALSTAWRVRGRLSPRDLVLLEAWAGPRYPQASTWAGHLQSWELALAAAPEKPESWYESGDIIFHYGRLLGIGDSRDRAGARFRRAAELDSAFAAPVGHLLELAALENDTAEVRRLAAAYTTLDSIGETSGFLRWRAASALGDRAALAAIRSGLPRMSITSLNRILGLSQLFGTSLQEALLAASVLADRAGTRVERWEWIQGLHSLALNRGRPQEALRWIEAWKEVEDDPGEALRSQVLDALFWDGDADAAARAVTLLETRLEGPPADDALVRETALASLCVAELWRLTRGDTDSAGETLHRVRSLGSSPGGQGLPPAPAVCAAILEGLLSVREGRSDAPEAMGRLEQLLLLGPPVKTTSDLSLVGNFLLAQWRESQGDLEGSLATMRRWHDHWFSGVCYLSTYLREEGRLAALVGDTVGAVEAYRHYLALRSDPEPELAGEVERVRADLEVLATDRSP
jgi:tetratricopeptide (TPR) repeat protein